MQLLLEHDITTDPETHEDQRAVSIGGLALGYNVLVDGPALELINQLYLDIPQDGEDLTFAITTGFVATWTPPPPPPPPTHAAGRGGSGEGRRPGGTHSLRVKSSR
jgi:hypothetical protein